jgi:exopolyphosphatase/guanosine-5'-triphosphate,3'-diphosphate pyrophosphatase
VTRAVAAIDCGTNSTRLLVVDEQGRTLERLMRITRLGQDVDETRRLSAAAIDRTVDVLREYRKVLDEHEVERLRMSATSAARDASNHQVFFDAAREVVGVEPELLDGETEARLSFAGATSDLDPADGPFLVVDIGGGSTEFAFGDRTPRGQLSIDLGCVRLTDQHLHGDPPRPEELTAALQLVESHLDDVARILPEAGQAQTFVGLAGTVTTVAAVEIGLHTYDRDRIHHFVLTKAAVEDVFRTLATEPLADRIHNPGLERGRADVIVGGCIVLVSVMRYFGFEACLVSERDILDGLAASIS